MVNIQIFASTQNRTSNKIFKRTNIVLTEIKIAMNTKTVKLLNRIENEFVLNYTDQK